MEIKGNTVLAKFIRQNLDELVEFKLKMNNKQIGFVYLHPDGELREGRNDQYGQSIVCAFGGASQNRFSAIKELQEIINTEPYDNDDSELKGYLN